MDEYLESISMACRLLAAADALEPGEPSHLVMNEFDLRGLLTAAGLGSDTIDEAVHHPVPHGHGAAKLIALEDTWGGPRPRCPECGGRTIPIVYGMPVPALGELAHLGVVELAGCVIDVEAPASAVRALRRWHGQRYVRQRTTRMPTLRRPTSGSAHVARFGRRGPAADRCDGRCARPRPARPRRRRGGCLTKRDLLRRA